MAQYIDKSALLAEIESYKNSFCDRNGYLEDSETNGLVYDTLCELEDSIDTLEVKEVQEEPVSNNYSALLPCIYNRTLEERVKCCKYCSAACEGRVKEPVSDELEEAAERLSTIYAGEGSVDPKREGFAFYIGFKNGAKWKNENLWKPADGDDLPEIDREVIALLDNGKVIYAHRPPEYWDGKSIATGKVTRYYPKTYGKGGWNIPDVKWWLDCLMPKEIEL